MHHDAQKAYIHLVIDNCLKCFKMPTHESQPAYLATLPCSLSHSTKASMASAWPYGIEVIGMSW